MCTNPLYNQRVFFVFFYQKLLLQKKDYKAIYRVTFGCLECILYILVRSTTWQMLKRFKCLRPLVHIDVPRLWRLLCDPLQLWFICSLTGRPEPHFADLFQLINKLTDLPYPISCCPPKILVQQNTMRSNAVDITLLSIQNCPHLRVRKLLTK